jgi:hypothetical protein
MSFQFFVFLIKEIINNGDNVTNDVDDREKNSNNS